MFASIKWRLIMINFILVFIAMMIVGFSIVGSLESQQLDAIRDRMEQDLSAIIAAASVQENGPWTLQAEAIQEVLNDWRLSSNSTVYVIMDADKPTIIAANVSTNEFWRGQSALGYGALQPVLVVQGLQGQKNDEIITDGDVRYLHTAQPVQDARGLTLGMFYGISNLSAVDTTVQQAQAILTRATMLALVVTVILGYFIANGITVPIRDVTRQAEEMAEGNFDQRVDVKSNDEIGQLGAMFNYLTRELKKSIERIDLERSKLDTIFHYMVEGVLALDGEFRLIQANPFAMGALGLVEDDIDKTQIGLWRQLNLPLDQEGRPVIEAGESGVDLRHRHYNVKYAPYRDEEGTLDGLIIVLQDVTKEHRLDSMRKDFVANVSHELKTPITTIKSYVETLIETGPKIQPDYQERFLRVIDEESDRMSDLVTDLLALSNLDYRQGFLDMEELNMNYLCQQMARRLNWLRKERGQVLLTNYDKDLRPIKGNRDALERVILNILSNAMKYTPVHGEIRMETRELGDHIEIIITDTGKGIPKEDQARIFERFYRVEKGRSRSSGGTGLGLAIARESVRAHGGDITLKSQLDKGTKMTISLPHDTENLKMS